MLREDLSGVPHGWVEMAAASYFTHTPFFAVTEPLRQLVARGTRDPAERQLEALERAVVAAGLQPQEAIPLLAPLLELPVPPGHPPLVAPPELARQRLLEMLATWMFAAARRQPLVVLFEDLQWADPSTLELQRILVEQGATAPLLLLYTARTEFKAPWAVRAHHTQITLHRLPRRQVGEMVALIGSSATLTPDVVDTLVGRADGVPLFVEELTKAVIESGTTAAVQEIPATLADSLMARLDRLGATAKEIAQVCAVLGRKFSYDLLEAVAAGPKKGLTSEALRAGLAKLVDAGLMQVPGGTPDVTYAFKHALVQDAAYASLLKSRRRALHNRVAQVLQQQFGVMANAHPELLARHWTEAGATEQALEAWRTAGDRAAIRGALREAVRHLEHGLAVLKAVPDGAGRDATEVTLQFRLAAILQITKGWSAPEAGAAYARARFLAERAVDPVQMALVLLGQCAAAINREGPQAAQLLADQGLAAAERAGLAPVQVWAHFAAGVSRYRAGNFAGASEHFDRALALYEESAALVVPIDPRVATLGYQGLTAWHLGLADQARSRAREAIERAEKSRRPADSAWAEHFAAALHCLLRDPASTRAHAARAMAATAKGPNPVHEAAAVMLEGWARAEEGEVDAGITMLREGFTRYVGVGQRTALEFYLNLLADAQARAGRLVDALALLAEAETAVPGEEVYRADTLRRRAELLARTSQGETDVERAYRSALETVERQGTKAYALRVGTSYARWLAGRGRDAEARALIGPLCATVTEGFDTRDVVDARGLLRDVTQEAALRDDLDKR
jgi:predicted ATPase